MTYDIQYDIYRHTPVFFNKFSIGEVISRSTNDITNYIAPLFGYGILLIFDGIIYNLFTLHQITKRSDGLAGFRYFCKQFSDIARNCGILEDFGAMPEMKVYRCRVELHL